MTLVTTARSINRDELIASYHRNRERSRRLFDLVADEAYYSRPIELRNPIVFYEGHLPAFSFNTLVKKGLGGASIDRHLEQLFARGIDPSAPSADAEEWPSREVVHQFAAEADRRVIDAMRSGDIEQPGVPLLDRAEAAYAILEHEAMHQETLLYMWHRLPLSQKRRPSGYQPRAGGPAPKQEWIDVPSGRATLGVDRTAVRFGWDNEHPSWSVSVTAFAIQRHDVTNAELRQFVDAGGYHDERWWSADDFAWLQQAGIEHPPFWTRANEDWCWLGMFDVLPLPPAWPVYVSHAEAAAYARWQGARLPTEAEFQRAAYGTTDERERQYPWGEKPPDSSRGVFDFASWDPYPAGSHPAGQSAWGIDDLIGNGWEWTSSTFAPFAGFSPLPSYPEYSADFFDGEHMVMKGASPATARELIRPSFRNWFRTRYPYVYATFRLAKDRQ